MLELAIFMAYKDRRINLISNSPNLISTQDYTLGTVYRQELLNVFFVQPGISIQLFFFFCARYKFRRHTTSVGECCTSHEQPTTYNG
jgi:hypothetical protein